ncbi:hypothetical protein [Thalassotalea mangrovi]|uniref:Uncharacterized protein n=1 Tax=Thalassotalea mangrovi TaxID=2572245 RepID=A0A4U1B5E6_9GAMM|nr:hypothetical protein [Thalassotalea mangrovi]TKB45657.1 hypothetical protein E8M12_07770 [Thalassotalea mangrovi]
MRDTKLFAKYLANFSEPEIASLAGFPESLQFSHVVVVPSYKESLDFVTRFNLLNPGEQTALLIAVINQPDTDSVKQPQQQLADDIKASATCLWQNNNLSLLQLTNGGYVLLVDRFNQAIPHKQGVGLARKIGADLACQLIATGQILSPWIRSTDADAHLPDNYFAALPQSCVDSSAIIFDFFHQSDNAQEDAANRIYEQSMRYYVAGLRFAGSPYSFYTIGSILAFSAEAYVKARGFPKRAAGEDFYLLNKVAKLGNITSQPSVQIKIDARVSDRVPFGTGPMVQKIIALQTDNKEYFYYQPQVFVELKRLLDAVSHCKGNLTELIQALESFSDLTRQSLTDIGFFTFINNPQLQSSSAQQVSKQLMVWFDAFKTLKFIHALRDNGLPDMPLSEALNNPFFSIHPEDK